MATIKSYTDLEQSEKLAKILPIESADMYWYLATKGNPKAMFNEGYNEYGDFELPCWSLAALRSLLPIGIKINENTYLFESHNTFDKSWVYRYYNEDGASHLYCKNTNEVDACVDMIIKLHEENLL